MSLHTHCYRCLRNLETPFPLKSKIRARRNLQYPLGQITSNTRVLSTTSSSQQKSQNSVQSVPPSSALSRPPTQTSNFPKSSLKHGTTIKPDGFPDTTAGNISSKLRSALPATTQTYVAYGICEILVKECARQADYEVPQRKEQNVPIPRTEDGQDLGVGSGWWYESLGLHATFGNWARITFLHMYILLVRLRCLPPDHFPLYSQHLLDHFFHMAEDRMISHHNISARSIRNKYLKDYFQQWRGLQAGYDEGLLKGDAVLGTAIWRNVFGAREDVDWKDVGNVVSYVRGCIKALEQMSDEMVTSGGGVAFGDPSSETEGVLRRSQMMDEVRAIEEKTL